MAPLRRNTAAFLLFLMTSPTWSQSDVSNMLMIIVDDLRPEIGRYLGTDNALNPDIRTPNIDALVDSGVAFTNAHTVVSSHTILFNTELNLCNWRFPSF